MGCCAIHTPARDKLMPPLRLQRRALPLGPNPVLPKIVRWVSEGTYDIEFVRDRINTKRNLLPSTRRMQTPNDACNSCFLVCTSHFSRSCCLMRSVYATAATTHGAGNHSVTLFAMCTSQSHRSDPHALQYLDSGAQDCMENIASCSIKLDHKRLFTPRHLVRDTHVLVTHALLHTV